MKGRGLLVKSRCMTLRCGAILTTYVFTPLMDPGGGRGGGGRLSLKLLLLTTGSVNMLSKYLMTPGTGRGMGLQQQPVLR